MATLLSLFSQYEILLRTAQYLTIHDLISLGSASKEAHSLILKSDSIFSRLKRTSLCCGHGLKARQDFIYPYNLEITFRRNLPQHDEELEVRVWNLKCDATNALPCLKCNINVCEECRFVPRVQKRPDYSVRRRPHHNVAFQSENVVCYCPPCDEKIERELPLSLSEYCNCDQFTRWICRQCKRDEDEESGEYYSKRTQFGDEMEDGGMWLGDNQHDRAFWCPCGERPPAGGNVRCSWCLRRHNQDTWFDEDPSKTPFDVDPCYPKCHDYYDPTM